MPTFEHYINKTRSILSKQHPNISAKVLDEISPKQFYPDKITSKTKGVLLIHGMLDSCSTMDSYYHSFTQQGFIVKSVLLPGHGMAPDSLLTIQAKDWLECVDFAVESFKDETQHLSIIGLSTGAILACHLALKYSKIQRLILFAPAFALKPKAKPLIKALQKFNEYFPKFAKLWLVHQKETDIAKYQSITTNSVFQLLCLIEKTTNALKNTSINCPIFTILSEDDETICSTTAYKVLHKQPNIRNKVLLYSNKNHHQVLQDSIEVISSCIPEQKILNYSHIAMHVAPSHPRYGIATQKQNKYLGAQTKQNLINYGENFARLTYNPNYQQLFEKILSFIEKNH